MKVLHLLTDTDRRGAQTFGFQLAAHLERCGLENRVVALRAGEPGGLGAEVLGRARLAPAALRALRRAMAEVDVTVAHGSTTLAASAIAGVGRKRPFVYRQISDPAYWTPTWAKRWRVRTLYRFPEQVVALTERSAELIRRRFGVADERITVIPNAVDAAAFDALPDRDVARAQLGLAGDERPVVLYVGSLTEEKGVLDLLSAPIASPHRVVLVGDGPLRARLQKDGEGGVVVLGPLQDVRAAYAAADLVALPSWSEELPAVLMEAGLAGLPVVATDVGSMSEIVDDGVSGLLVLPRDPKALAGSIDDLLGDTAKRLQMGEAGRARVSQRFSFDAVVSRWVNLLASVGARRR